MAIGFSHPKVTVHVGDGLAFMRKLKDHDKFDVIITDSSDPLGPAVKLYHQEYYDLMHYALNPGGIVCSQGMLTFLLNFLRNGEDHDEDYTIMHHSQTFGSKMT